MREYVCKSKRTQLFGHRRYAFHVPPSSDLEFARWVAGADDFVAIREAPRLRSSSYNTFMWALRGV